MSMVCGTDEMEPKGFEAMLAVKRNGTVVVLRNTQPDDVMLSTAGVRQRGDH